AQVADHITHHPFGTALGIDLGVVEEIDPVVPCRGDQVAGLAAADLVAEGDPGAEGQRRKLQPGGAETTVLHGKLQIPARVCASGRQCSPPPVAEKTADIADNGAMPAIAGICPDYSCRA